MFLSAQHALVPVRIQSRAAAHRARRQTLLGLCLVWSLLAGAVQHLPSQSTALAAAVATAKTTATPAFPPAPDPHVSPTPAPTVTPPPDTDYVDQAIAAEWQHIDQDLTRLPESADRSGTATLDPQVGGQVRSADGRFRVSLRPNALPAGDPAAVTVTRPTFPKGDPRAARADHPLAELVDLTATAGKAGTRIPHFNSEAILEWTLDPAVLAAAGVRGFPHVYTFNEATKTWDEILSYWDQAGHRLLARTPHFSLYGVGDGFDAVNNYLPTINNFEVNLQSGTASINYPLNLPAGPGGLGPQISLSYNSGAADRVDPSQQGDSDVGWGWTLSMSYIAATQHTYGTYHPWTASITSDGVNGDLIKGTDGYWHTAQEGFARIQYNPPSSGHHDDDSWEAWDSNGTHYVFDQRALALDQYNLTNSAPTLVANRWMLHTVTDTHNNTITYSYQYETGSNTLTTSPITGAITQAVYPYQIQWGATDGSGAKLQASFNVSSRTIGTTTDATTWDKSGGYVHNWRVDRLDVSRKQQPSGSFALLRSYRFSQDYSLLLPGTGTHAGSNFPHLTLTGITAVGNDNSTTLPPTTFVYYCTVCGIGTQALDDGHIYKAFNGYGGETRYYYDAAGNGITSAYRRVRARRLLDGLDPTSNTVHNVPYYYDYRGAVLNTVEQSDETNAQYPQHTARNEFRGFAWVRVTDPLGQATDHYFTQNDANKAQEWRVQTGQTVTMTDSLNTAPPVSAWTTTGSVQGLADPADGTNGTWRMNTTGGTMTRTGSVGDGSDVSVRLLPNFQAGQTVTTKWLLQNANGNGEYWGVQLASQNTVNGWALYPKVIWHVWNGSAWVNGSRDLSPNVVTGNPLRPQYAGTLEYYPTSGTIWYRLHLHPGPDGRFVVELTRDDGLGGYSSVHSGEPADSGTVPSVLAGQNWKFSAQLTPGSGNGWAAYVDDYSESRTVYSENDTVYTAQTLSSPASGWAASAWVGATNNTGGMTIRFVPATETWTAEFGNPATQPGQVRRTRSTTVYNSYGQVAEQYQYGDLAVTGDETSVHTAYIRNSIAWITKPQWRNSYKTITGNVGGSNFIAQTTYAYDGLASGATPTKGDLTEVDQANLLNGVYQTNPASIATKTTYDSFGNVLKTTDPNNHDSPVTGYDPYYVSFPITTTYPNSRVETVGYNYIVDAPQIITDVNGLVTQRRYDPMGRPTKAWQAANAGSEGTPNESYSFPDLNQTSVTPPFYISLSTLTGDGSSSTWATRWYDGRGRTVQDVTPKDGTHQIVINRTYTMTGQIYTATLPYAVNIYNRFTYSTPDSTKPGVTTYYDGLGRTTMTLHPDGTSAITNYDYLGWVGTQDETRNGYKAQHTDVLGRLDQVLEQDLTISPTVSVYTGYGYDLLGHQTSVTRDQGGSQPTVSTLTYDGLGRKVTMQDPDMGFWTYGYDDAGNLTHQEDALYNGDPTNNPTHQVYFKYDTMNRPTAKYYGATHYTNLLADVKYYYDDDLGDAATKASWGKLRLAEVTVQGQGSANANGHGYEYNVLGQTIAEVITTTYTTRAYRTSSTFDVGGRANTLTYPDSATSPEVVTYGYNMQGAGLPVSLTSNVSGNAAPVYNTTYNDRGQMLTLLQGGTSPSNNLLTSSFTYDDSATKRGWLTNITVTSTAGTALNETFGYYANGNTQTISQTASGTNNPTFSNSYTYDGLDRLKTATGTLFASESYSFDSLGRMTTRTIGGTPKTYSYGDSNHKDAPTGYNGLTYSYDSNGSQVTTTGQSRSFDPEGRLVSVTAGSTTSSFVYDGNGQRVLKTVNDGKSVVRTLYIGALYEEQLGSGSINYYHFGGKSVGLRRSGFGIGNGQYRLVGDQLGSTTLLVDTATPPSVSQRQYHKPYGELAWQWQASGSLTSVSFTGQRLDSDSGLMYYGARFYDPALGYFVSADTIGVDKGAAQSRNRYSYVLNSPTTYNDPSGHNPRFLPDEDPNEEPEALPDADNPNKILHPKEEGRPDGCQESDTRCRNAYARLQALGFDLTLGAWTADEMETYLAAIRDLMAKAGWTEEAFRHEIGADAHTVRLWRNWGKDEQEHFPNGVPVAGERLSNGLHVFNDMFNHGEAYAKRWLVHETGHLIDAAFRGGHRSHVSGAGYASRYAAHGGSGEDFAECIAYMVYPDYKDFNVRGGYHINQARINYIRNHVFLAGQMYNGHQ